MHLSPFPLICTHRTLQTWHCARIVSLKLAFFSSLLNSLIYIYYYIWILSWLQVEPGHTILVHAAAGGVGSLLSQWANSLGATVIGTVSTKEKAAQAKDDGCHDVIIYKEEDFVARVNEITSGNGVDVVYDSVGKDTFQVLAVFFFLLLSLCGNFGNITEIASSSA